MNLKPVLGRQSRPPMPPAKRHIEFDFAVAKRPQYIPGLSLPLAPVLPMPSHDKDGYIIEEVVIYSELRYLVGYKEQPSLRVSVKLPNILDWVSPRALEQYHNKKADEQERRRKEIELPLIEAKEKREKKRLEKLSRDGLSSETQSRKRKHGLDALPSTSEKSDTKNSGRPFGPGRMNRSMENEVSLISPKPFQHAQRQPSLSAAGGTFSNQSVLDLDSDDEASTATEIALASQLNVGKNLLASGLSSRSASNTLPIVAKGNIRSRFVSKLIDTSQEDSSSVLSVQGTPHRRSHHLPPSILHGNSAVAGTSSRAALKVYKDLEHKNRKSHTLTDKYSHSRKAPQSQTFKGAHIGLAGLSRGAAEVISDNESIKESKSQDSEDESEFEVECILNDEIRFTKDGKAETWYLIKWVGEWDDTWEPAENVGSGAIRDYEDQKRNTDDELGDESDPDSLFVSHRKGKGKEVKRGQVIDDGDDDGDDGDDGNDGDAG